MTPAEPTRREFIRDAARLGAAVTAATLPSTARAANRSRARKPTVAILGGGVAGLTAAHELAERGFNVDVYEHKALGGKARSIPVPESATGGRLPLPGEHGYRFCIGTYQYLPETMQRIPTADGRSVYDNLEKSGDFLVARADGKQPFHTFLLGPPPSLTLDLLETQLVAELQFFSSAPPDEVAFFVRQVLIYLTSSDERRFGQWEYMTMWDYMQADGKSVEYQRLLCDYVSHVIQSTPAKLASARAHMQLWEAVVYSAVGQGDRGRSFAELLNAPTNEAWIDPWAMYLQSLGARFHVGQTVEALDVRRGHIVSARVRDRHQRRHTVEADYFVLAVPVERAQRLIGNAILAADPTLEQVHNIETRWMNGIQFYLRRQVQINHGHVAYVDSPWFVSSISQAQFWPCDFARTYGDGSVQDCLSAIASDWFTPGTVYGKAARDCTPEQIAHEVWAQMKAALEGTGKSYLPDDVLHSWFLDPGIRRRISPDGTRDDEPLFIQTPGLWDHRPVAATGVPNLFLAADYVRNQSAIDTASMDGANAAARAAVNALLEAAGSRTPPVPVYKRYSAPEFEAAKQLDAALYRAGKPHVLDTPWPTSGNNLSTQIRQVETILDRQ
jgi:uncharacterized protein with NAD-binding domain and iron-sulfur cluster